MMGEKFEKQDYDQALEEEEANLWSLSRTPMEEGGTQTAAETSITIEWKGQRRQLACGPAGASEGCIREAWAAWSNLAPSAAVLAMGGDLLQAGALVLPGSTVVVLFVPAHEFIGFMDPRTD